MWSTADNFVRVGAHMINKTHVVAVVQQHSKEPIGCRCPYKVLLDTGKEIGLSENEARWLQSELRK
jgi:hypothetical protein